MVTTPHLLALSVAIWAANALALASTPSPGKAAITVAFAALAGWGWQRRRSLLLAALTLGALTFAGTTLLWARALAAAREVESEGMRAGALVLTAPLPIEPEAPWMPGALAGGTGRAHRSGEAPANTPARVAFDAELTLREGPARPPLRARVSAPAALAAQPGEFYELVGRLHAWPTADWEEGFDAQTVFARRGLSAAFSLTATALATREDGGMSLWQALDTRVRRAQRQAAETLRAQSRRAAPSRDDAGPAASGAGLAAAIVTGDRAGVSRQESEALSRAGIVHVVSVSGLHLSAAALIFYALLRAALGVLLRWRAFSAKRWAALAALVPMAGYAWFTGSEVPAVRSALMCAAMMLALAGGRRGNIRRALALALLLLTVANPLGGLELGFLFSFTSVFALVVWGERVTPRAATLPWRRLTVPVLAIGTSSLVASLFSWPLSAHFFTGVSLAGLWCNFVAVPLTSVVIVPAGLLWLATYFCGTPSALLAAGLARAAALLGGLARHLGQGGALPLYLHTHEMLLAYALLIALFTMRREAHRQKQACVALALALGICFVWPLARRHLARAWEVHFLPVGQGDSTVFFGPRGQVMVIDGGGDFAGAVDPGRRVLVPFLLSHRVFAVDNVILTHAHPDHFGGLKTLLEQIPCGALWHNGQGDITLLERAAARHRTQVALLGEARAPALEGASIDWLHPRPGDGETYFAELGLNDNSVVFRLSAGGRRVLMCGDVERLGEAWLLEHDRDRLAADVIKIAHHGSHTSTSPELLRAVGPAAAVIEAGRDNTFGHPHREVLEALGRAGVEIFRTDVGGHVVARLPGSGGGPVAIEAFRR